MAKAPTGLKASKSKLFIGGNVSALGSETSWTFVGFVREMSGSLGDSWKTADATTLDDDYERTMKTLRSGGDLTAKILFTSGDAGQAALIAAKDDGVGAPYNFKLELGDKPAGVSSTPTMFKFEALVMSAPVSGFSPTRLVERDIKLDIQGAVSEIAKVTAA